MTGNPYLLGFSGPGSFCNKNQGICRMVLGPVYSQGNDFWNGKPVSETLIPESEYFTYPQKKDMT